MRATTATAPQEEVVVPLDTIKGSTLTRSDEYGKAQKEMMQKCLTHINQELNGGLLGATALENSNFTANSAQGLVVTIKGDSPARGLLPLLQRMGGRISVYQIPEGRFKSAADTQGTFTKLNVPANLNENDPAAAGMPQISEVAQETTPWTAQMGSNNANFAGVFTAAQLDRRSRGARSYYLVAHTGADAQTAQLREWIGAPENSALTVRDVANSDRYARLESTAERNNLTVVARACTVLGIDVPITDDTDGAKIAEYHCSKQPVKDSALTAMTHYGALRTDPSTGNVLLYANTISLQDCTGKAIAMPIDALNGVQLLHLAPQHTSASISPSVGKVVKNKFYNALPLGGARNPVAQQLTDDELNTVMHVLYWKGKDTKVGLEGISARIGRSTEPLFLKDIDLSRDHGLADLNRIQLEPVAVVINV